VSVFSLALALALVLVLAFELSTQRFALLALGQAWTLLGSSINSQPEKCLKIAQNPQRPVHALLGVFVLKNTLSENKNNRQDDNTFI